MSEPLVIRRPGKVGTVATPNLPRRRYTFSPMDDEEPISPKTPMLAGARQAAAKALLADDSSDPVVSIPAVIDSCVITMQNRMETVNAAQRKDPDTFDEDEHKMEYDMLNALYFNTQNVAYHINKVVRTLNPREDKWPKPSDGVGGLDMIAGLRTALTRCVEGGTTLCKLVRKQKSVQEGATTRDVLGDSLATLEHIEAAMRLQALKSGHLVDRLKSLAAARSMSLMKNAAAAFMTGGGKSDDPRTFMLMVVTGWREQVAYEKKERAMLAQMEGEEDHALAG